MSARAAPAARASRSRREPWPGAEAGAEAPNVTTSQCDPSPIGYDCRGLARPQPPVASTQRRSVAGAKAVAAASEKALQTNTALPGGQRRSKDGDVQGFSAYDRL